MNRVLNLAAFNIRVLLGDPTWFILSWALFALQLAIYGSLISRLVGSNLPNYFFFYSIALMIIFVFDWVSPGRWYLCLSSLSKRWTSTWRSWRDSLLF